MDEGQPPKDINPIPYRSTFQNLQMSGTVSIWFKNISEHSETWSTGNYAIFDPFQELNILLGK